MRNASLGITFCTLASIAPWSTIRTAMLLVKTLLKNFSDMLLQDVESEIARHRT